MHVWLCYEVHEWCVCGVHVYVYGWCEEYGFVILVWHACVMCLSACAYVV